MSEHKFSLSRFPLSGFPLSWLTIWGIWGRSELDVQYTFVVWSTIDRF